jgi:hypothetical protein
MTLISKKVILLGESHFDLDWLGFPFRPGVGGVRTHQYRFDR